MTEWNAFRTGTVCLRISPPETKQKGIIKFVLLFSTAEICLEWEHPIYRSAVLIEFLF